MLYYYSRLLDLVIFATREARNFPLYMQMSIVASSLKILFLFLPPLLLHLNEMHWQKKVCNQSQNWVTDSFLLTAASLRSEKIFLLKYPGVSGVIFCMTLLYLVSNSISRSFEHDFVFMQIAEVRGNSSIDDFLRFWTRSDSQIF